MPLLQIYKPVGLTPLDVINNLKKEDKLRNTKIQLCWQT